MANTRIGKDEQGKSVVYRLGQDSQGNKSWIKTDEPTPEQPAPKQPKTRQEMESQYMEEEGSSYLERKMKNKSSDYERELALRGPAAQQRAKEAEEMGKVHKMLLLAGDETKALGTGVKELEQSNFSDVVRNVASNMIMPGLDLFNRSPEEKAEGAEDLARYKKERATEKELFREVDESADLTQIARMAPYSFTGLAEVPIASGIRSGLGGVSKLTRGNAPGAIRGTGRPTVLPQYMASGVTGMGEGALREDEDFLEGGLSSIVGKLGGEWLGRKLERATNKNSDMDNALIKKYRKKRYQASPGMRTGNELEQRLDFTQANDPRYMGIYDAKKTHNDGILLKDVIEATGFKLKNGDPKNLSTITPEELNGQILSLKSEYNALESNTTGHIPTSKFVNIMNRINELPDEDVGRIKKDFMRFAGSKKNKEGNFVIGDLDFNGANYQDQLRRLKSGKKRALADTNREMALVYDDMMSAMATGLEGGMKKDQVERWRDLNERWAMTSLIKEKGLDVNNRIDTEKLFQEINSNDIDRLVTGKGGRIRAFHDVVRMKGIENSQTKPGMGEGLGDLTDAERKAINKARPTFHSGPEKSDPTAMNEAMINYQYGNTPLPARKVYGLLGLPQQGVFSTGGLMRAMEQGTDSKRNAYEYVSDKAGKAKRFTESKYEGLMDILDQY